MEKKIKPSKMRRPDSLVPHGEILKDVANNTGFNKTDIEICINEYLSVIRAELLERNVVKMKGIGTIYPMVQPARKVTNMGGTAGKDYNRMIMEARWTIKFSIESELIEDVRDIMVTKRDLEWIYYKQ